MRVPAQTCFIPKSLVKLSQIACQLQRCTQHGLRVRVRRRESDRSRERVHCALHVGGISRGAGSFEQRLAESDVRGLMRCTEGDCRAVGLGGGVQKLCTVRRSRRDAQGPGEQPLRHSTQTRAWSAAPGAGLFTRLAHIGSKKAVAVVVDVAGVEKEEDQHVSQAARDALSTVTDAARMHHRVATLDA